MLGVGGRRALNLLGAGWGCPRGGRSGGQGCPTQLMRLGNLRVNAERLFFDCANSADGASLWIPT